MAAASLTERKSRRSVYYELCESGALFVCVCVRVCVRMCAWGSGEAGRESVDATREEAFLIENGACRVW